MKFKYIKIITFYTVLTAIIIYSLTADKKAWAEKETDLINTIGSKPYISSKVESFKITDRKGNLIKSEQLDQGDHLLILWNIEDGGRSKLFFDMVNELISCDTLIDISVIPVNIGDKLEEIEAFFKENEYNFDWYMDSGKSTKWAFNRSNDIPIAYLLDNHGIVQLRQEVGSKSYNEHFLNRIKQLF